VVIILEMKTRASWHVFFFPSWISFWAEVRCNISETGAARCGPIWMINWEVSPAFRDFLSLSEFVFIFHEMSWAVKRLCFISNSYCMKLLVQVWIDWRVHFSFSVLSTQMSYFFFKKRNSFRRNIMYFTLFQPVIFSSHEENLFWENIIVWKLALQASFCTTFSRKIAYLSFVFISVIHRSFYK